MYDKLNRVMLERGITRYRLSKMAKISTQDLYSALGGKKPLYPNWKKRIAQALEIPEEELFKEVR